MRYVLSRLRTEQRDKAYRLYITDALKAIGGLNIRYAEIIDPGVEETRSPDEIKDSITSKLRKMQNKKG